jgi:hypothetical protein
MTIAARWYPEVRLEATTSQPPGNFPVRYRKIRKIMLVTLVSVSALLILIVAGCMRISNGTWYFWNAPVPVGWPELTPIGKVEVRAYPAYRAATVTDVDGGGMSPMFTALFNHIKREDIAMTAPVDMGYAETQDTPRMTTMAFLYRRPDLGEVGTDGAVRVEDLASRVFASVGVRGDYTPANYEKGLTILKTWLSENGQWDVTGPPRYLGYNGPFVPPFARYGEVQLPVAER